MPPPLGHLLVSAGEELFALQPADGALVWRRNVGAAVQRTAGDAALAVLAGERRTELDASDGTRRSSRAASSGWPAAPADDAPEGAGWPLAGNGALALDELRGDAADALVVEGSALLPRVSADASFWIAATRAGRIARVEPVEGALDASGAPAPLRVVWEQRLPEALGDVHATPDWIVLRLASGALVELASDSGQERRRWTLARSERHHVSESGTALLIHGERALRVHALPGGEARFEIPLESPALAAELTGSDVVWVDRDGVAHVADARSGARRSRVSLGLHLKEARVMPDGFGVLSDSGEVGFVELRSPGAPGAAPASPGELDAPRNE